MNCLEYRRLMEAAPRDAGSDAKAHARQCPVCAEFTRRVMQFDDAVGAATRIPVPENLEDRILMSQSFAAPGRRVRWRHRLAAMAAAVLLTVAVAVFLAASLHRESELHRELVALVEAADYALEARGPVPGVALSDALRPVGLAVDGPVGPVSFAGRCLVRGKLSGHLVLRDVSEPVSVFLMPAERVLRRSTFDDGAWHGVLVPAEDGTVGIVVPEGVHVAPSLERRLLRSVRWPA